MSFHEKSAWLMSVALLVGGYVYFSAVNTMSAELGALAPPILPLIVGYTAILIVIAIVGHIIIAVIKPSDADDTVDERDRVVLDRAGHWSGYVMGFGVISALGCYLFMYDGNLLFYTVFASVMLAQFAEYVLQIVFYRAVV